MDLSGSHLREAFHVDPEKLSERAGVMFFPLPLPSPFLLSGGVPIPVLQAELSLHCFGPDQARCPDCNSSPGRWGDRLAQFAQDCGVLKLKIPCHWNPLNPWPTRTVGHLGGRPPAKLLSTSRITHGRQHLQILTYLKHMNLESVFKAAD